MAEYACECCGYRTLDQAPSGTMQICPVCFWEDTLNDGYEAAWWNGSNGITLLQAQRNYRSFGASSEDYLDSVREPKAKEARADD